MRGISIGCNCDAFRSWNTVFFASSRRNWVFFVVRGSFEILNEEVELEVGITHDVKMFNCLTDSLVSS